MPIHDQFLVATQSFVLRRTPRLHLSPQEEFCGQFSAENNRSGDSQECHMAVTHTGTSKLCFPFLSSTRGCPEPRTQIAWEEDLPLPVTAIWILPDVQSYSLSQKNIKILVGLYVFISSLHEWCSPGQELFHFWFLLSLNLESGTR